MIQINLLPIRTRKKRELARQFVSVYLLTIVLVCAAMAYIWFDNAREIDSLNSRLSQVQREVEQYKKFEALLQELTKKKEIVDKKRSIISDLQKDRDSIVRILALLSVQIPPEKMWFDRLVQAGNSMTLDGVALSNEAIVEFMRNLESSPYVEKGSVNLVHSRQTVVSDKKLREFQLNYRFFSFSDVQKRLKSQAS